jgi:hypothetical protein
MTIQSNRIVALGVAGALAIGFAVSAGPVFAAPVPSNTAAVNQAAPGNVIDVRHRGWHRGPGPWIAGAALGIAGAVIANEAYRGRYYDGYGPGYGYGPYPYAAPYPAQRYRGGYAAPYGSCDNGATC